MLRNLQEKEKNNALQIAWNCTRFLWKNDEIEFENKLFEQVARPFTISHLNYI